MLLNRKSNNSTSDVLKQIRREPSIDSIRHLPLYAQMIIESIDDDNRLPLRTKYRRLASFICILIKQQLPIRDQKFKQLCYSAYETLETNINFVLDNILSNSYGLLSHISSLIPQEEMKLYQFKHISIQDYLAALHCHINNDDYSESGIKLLIDLYMINHPGFRTIVQMYSLLKW